MDEILSFVTRLSPLSKNRYPSCLAEDVVRMRHLRRLTLSPITIYLLIIRLLSYRRPFYLYAYASSLILHLSLLVGLRRLT